MTQDSFDKLPSYDMQKDTKYRSASLNSPQPFGPMVIKEILQTHKLVDVKESNR